MNRKHGHSERPQKHQSLSPRREGRTEDTFSAKRSFRDSAYNTDSTYDGGEMGDYDSGARRGQNRQASSSERFGYPSNVNAWAGNDREYYSDRTPGRMGRSGWSTQDSDMDLAGSPSYGEGSFDRTFDETNTWQTTPDNRPEWRSYNAERGHFGKGPKGYKRSDDRIKEEVCETLARNPRIDASDIEVEVSDSIVSLSGTVESKDMRRAAEIAIENLSGVDDVRNDIRVKKMDNYATSSDSSFSSSAATKNVKSLMNKGSSHA